MAIRERTFRFTGAEGASIAGFRWADDAVTPRAVLQVAHGMGEHARRYKAPLEPLMTAIVPTAANRAGATGTRQSMTAAPAIAM